jgi:hypothetical protein
MAGFGQSSRRSGFGGNSRGPSAPTRAAASAPSSQGERSGRGDKPRSVWTTVTALYDPYHSSMEPQIVSEFYRTAFCIKLAPVFAERRGPDDGGSGKKYDHDNAAMIEALTGVKIVAYVKEGDTDLDIDVDFLKNLYA